MAGKKTEKMDGRLEAMEEKVESMREELGSMREGITKNTYNRTGYGGNTH